ncbi:MAG: RibD family protein [Pseudorhodoplanes sp.]|nr:Riboflavin biosynthesis protein RibD [Pseudorhodoplanes sp.]MCQ3941917.1 riboflavin deaminase [Alphaproteobacteria bacterium]MBW7948081.1 RibD family protein [Pseudorhodoplanes sp.]MCL4712947.1 RibD family protein [Pseudorhodoplanes sp.]MCZ7642554.1 RibD family protein [Pseudorhodoplanes sp.]
MVHPFTHNAGERLHANAHDEWASVPGLFRSANEPLPACWSAIFGPLRAGRPDAPFAVGQIGQSLDGRIATATGHSHYVNGPHGLEHLHRLRAVMDAVVVGIGTALADDPQLTVRRVEGPSPARVVIDPQGRLPGSARLLAADGVRRIIVTRRTTATDWPADIEKITLTGNGDGIAPSDILAALGSAGFRRILIEGGANTVSRFLAAGCLDRLHIVVAPVLIGSGPSGVTLPPIAWMDEAIRPAVAMHPLGDEMLFDCDFSAQRKAWGRVNTSA